MSQAITKIRALRKIIGELQLPNGKGMRARYFDPAMVLEYFERFNSLALELKHSNPLFRDLKIRETPKPSDTTDFDGRGYITGAQIRLLLSDVDYCLNVFDEDSNTTNTFFKKSDLKAPEKITIPWLKDHVPIQWWFWAGAGIISVFFAGIQATRINWIVDTLNQIKPLALTRPEKQITPDSSPILSPQSEKLLRLIYHHQTNLGLEKLIIGTNGQLYFDNEEMEKNRNVNLIQELYHIKDGFDSYEKNFETVLLSIPNEYITHVPQARLGGAYVVKISHAGIVYLKGKQ